jgi:molybdate/tungstate transport system substrate-binding protein
MRRLYIGIIAIATLVILLFAFFFATNLINVNSSNQTLKVYCATSLLFPLQKVETSFERAHPEINVEIEGHGTIQVIRHVTELNEKIDLILVADYSLIPRMMYTTKMPNSNEEFANYYVRFATNTIVLAYSDQSKYANEINTDNWYTILSRPDVSLGFANPQLDAIGYRALMAIQLAEDHYAEPNLFHNLVTANLDPPISSIPNESNHTIYVPLIQQPKNNKLILRASEVDLIGLLETGHLDYSLIYLSNAKQYGFKYVELPDEINMGSLQHQNNYERIQVTFEHQRFATITLDRTGEVIYYGLTIPKNAPNPQLAEKFINFILNEDGKTNFESAYHPIFNPSFSDNLPNVPQSLQPVVTKEP